jgi:hypothetical protein
MPSKVWRAFVREELMRLDTQRVTFVSKAARNRYLRDKIHAKYGITISEDYLKIVIRMDRLEGKPAGVLALERAWPEKMREILGDERVVAEDPAYLAHLDNRMPQRHREESLTEE